MQYKIHVVNILREFNLREFTACESKSTSKISTFTVISLKSISIIWVHRILHVLAWNDWNKMFIFSMFQYSPIEFKPFYYSISSYLSINCDLCCINCDPCVQLYDYCWPNIINTCTMTSILVTYDRMIIVILVACLMFSQVYLVSARVSSKFNKAWIVHFIEITCCRTNIFCTWDIYMYNTAVIKMSHMKS